MPEPRTGAPLTAGSPSGGPLGEIPRGDKACLLSHRAAWEQFVASGEAHAVLLEDDVRLSPGGGGRCWRTDALDSGRTSSVVKLEHYGPPGQRVLLADIHAVGRGFPHRPDAVAPYRRRGLYPVARAAEILLAEQRFDLPVDHLLFNPNNSHLVRAACRPGSCCRPWRGSRISSARNPISKATRMGLRNFGLDLCEARAGPLRL